MRVKSVTEFRKTIASDLDQVEDDHEPLLVTRTGGRKPVVVVSLEDYNSWQETNYLMSSPANAERLLRSIKEANEGKLIEHDLME